MFKLSSLSRVKRKLDFELANGRAERTFAETLMSCEVPRGEHSACSSLHFRTDSNANCAGRRLAARGGIASKISCGKAIEAFPLSSRAVLCFFHVRCSANRAGDPIVAEKRPDYYAINYPELQARIEIAHRPLIEVNDAARR